MKTKTQKNQTVPSKAEFIDALKVSAELSALAETASTLAKLETNNTDYDPRQYTLLDGVYGRIELLRQRLADHPVYRWCGRQAN